MPKDPERYGFAESADEDIDDMLVGAGRNPKRLQVLLALFEEMINIAMPFTNKETGEIRAPKERLPITQLTPAVKQGVDNIDCAFVDTMSYTTWVQLFHEGYNRVRKKFEQVVGADGLGENLK
ncbi:MAG: hypothetical protein QF442_00085 [Candidatus Peribacteraceae bacterium]|nr:hypothetical protein [Candidatus Peribacteraceae bacterium]